MNLLNASRRMRRGSGRLCPKLKKRAEKGMKAEKDVSPELLAKYKNLRQHRIVPTAKIGWYKMFRLQYGIAQRAGQAGFQRKRDCGMRKLRKAALC